RRRGRHLAAQAQVPRLTSRRSLPPRTGHRRSVPPSAAPGPRRTPPGATMCSRTLRRSLVAVTTAVAALSLTSGCVGPAAAPGGVTAAGSGGAADGSFELAPHIQQRLDDDKPMRIKLSNHDPSLAFATPIGAGMEKAGKEFGADVALIGPTGGDAAKQVSEI